MSELLSYLLASFWSAPSEALFNQKQLAVVLSKSAAWFELKRCQGGGIPFRKIGRSCMYQKADVIAWIETHHLVASTSEYPISPSAQGSAQ